MWVSDWVWKERWGGKPKLEQVQSIKVHVWQGSENSVSLRRTGCAALGVVASEMLRFHSCPPHSAFPSWLRSWQVKCMLFMLLCYMCCCFYCSLFIQSTIYLKFHPEERNMHQRTCLLWLRDLRVKPDGQINLACIPRLYKRQWLPCGWGSVSLMTYLIQSLILLTPVKLICFRRSII